MSDVIYLSRRNLTTLLSKLDRQKEGENTQCMIIKFQNSTDPYVQTMDACAVIAVEDDAYYTKRRPGEVHPSDQPDVDTRDAPAPQELVIDLDALGARVLIGSEPGEDARSVFLLDDIDSEPNVVVKVIVPDYVYSISSTFFSGFLERSIRACGSVAVFEKKFKFEMKKNLIDVLDSVVWRTLNYK